MIEENMNTKSFGICFCFEVYIPCLVNIGNNLWSIKLKTFWNFKIKPLVIHNIHFVFLFYLYFLNILGNNLLVNFFLSFFFLALPLFSYPLLIQSIIKFWVVRAIKLSYFAKDKLILCSFLQLCLYLVSARD